MNLREALRNKKLNNKGSAIVLVIIAMGFIGLLASMILWMTYMNYLMKTTDKKSTDNFYNAEVIMEEIKVGLQDTVSDAMSKAYRKTLESYTLLDNDDQRKAYFQNEMKKELTTYFMGSDANHYDFQLIKDCVDTKVNTTNASVKPYVNVRCVNYANASKFDAAHDPAMALMETSVSDNTILLRNVDVVYTDQNGFISAIHSDFRLAVPEVKFSNMSVSANFADYSLVANEQLLSSGSGNSMVTIEGSVYGGNGGSEADGLGKDSIVLGSGANWTFQNGGKLVTKKAVSLGENAKLNIKDDEVWVGNLSLDAKNAVLDMDSSAHVKDDLTIWKENGQVSLAGSYYGFGIGTNTEETEEDGSGSSAIIINGKKSTLDLTNLKNIWIGGRSYIATKQDTEGYTSPISTIKNVNIPMSESIAVRGNQVAYLVPPEALCVYKGSNLVRSNPISAEEYAKTVLLYENDPDFIEVDLQNTLMPGTEHYLSDYTANPAKGWKKIVARGHNGANLIYYYMNMEPEQANEFFKDYYGVDRNKNVIDNTLRVYANDDIQVTDDADAKIETAGNWLSYDKAAKSVSLNEASVSSNEAMMNFYYSNEFDALNAKLIPDKSSLSMEELSRSVYENLVDETIVKNKVGTGKEATFTFTDTDGKTYKGIVSTKDSYTYGGDSDVRLILCQGSVYLPRNYKGIVFAKKNIYVSPGIKIEAAPDDVSKVMGAKDSSNNFIYMMFRDGSKYAMQEDTESVSGNAAKKSWGLNELVVYENWSKQ